MNSRFNSLQFKKIEQWKDIDNKYQCQKFGGQTLNASFQFHLTEASTLIMHREVFLIMASH